MIFTEPKNKMEEEVELFINPKTTEEVKNFIEKYGIEPDKIANMRKSALGSIDAIREKIEKHYLDKDMILAIEKSEEMQNKFAEICRRNETQKNVFDTLDELLELSEHEQAGFMLFMIRNNEEKWNIKLLSEEERIL